MTIHISSTLSERVRSHGLSPVELRQNFYDLISGYPSDFFGWNVKNTNSEYVWHVHIVPDDADPKIKTWMNNKNHFTRKSDNLLFYINDGRNNFLLTTIVKPDGHSVFRNIDYLQNLEKIAENFVIRGIIP